jgi:hypothetical protein
MKYSRRKDKYDSNVLNDNFREIEGRLNDLEGGSGGGGGTGSVDVDYEKIAFDTEEIVVETESESSDAYYDDTTQTLYIEGGNGSYTYDSETETLYIG